MNFFEKIWFCLEWFAAGGIALFILSVLLIPLMALFPGMLFIAWRIVNRDRNRW